MLSYRDSRITKIALALFFIVVIGYGYFEARGLLFGPIITITSEIGAVHEPFITIQGRADRIVSLSMNGKKISVTESGVFEVPFVLAPGNNHIIFDAVDKYGHTLQKTLEIVYVPAALPATVAPMRSTTTETQ